MPQQQQMSSLQDLMVDTLKDLYDTEKQSLKNGPKIADQVRSPELEDVLMEHIQQTEQQVKRLEQVFQQLGVKPHGKPSKGAQGIIHDNQKLLRQKGQPDVKEAGLICGLQKMEHYEIAGYGTAVTFAKMLGNKEGAKLLAQTLDEEKSTDKALTDIAVQNINVQAKEQTH